MLLKFLCLFVLGNAFCNAVQHFLISEAQLQNIKSAPKSIHLSSLHQQILVHFPPPLANIHKCLYNPFINLTLQNMYSDERARDEDMKTDILSWLECKCRADKRVGHFSTSVPLDWYKAFQCHFD